MTTLLTFAACVLLLTTIAFADVIVEPPAADPSSASVMPLVFAGAAVVCVVIAVLIWFIRKRT